MEEENNCLTERFRLDSSDGKHQIAVTLYCPPEEKIRGVLQFSHGMTEHFGRYREMAEHFCKAGFAVCGNDHLGHGDSISDPEDLGFFAECDGADTVVTDLYKVTRYLKDRYPEKPLFLIGHSMGSFLARLYAMTYGRELTGLVLLGTGGKKAGVGFGKALASLIGAFHGPRYRSNLLKKLAFAGYNSRCGERPDPSAWLSTDPNAVQQYDADEKCGFTFTVRGYYDLFDMVDRTNRKTAFSSYPKNLPILIMSGKEDPVGNYGKGPAFVAKSLQEAGQKDVTLVLYPEARHELQNETCRYRFFSELRRWLEQYV